MSSRNFNSMNTVFICTIQNLYDFKWNGCDILHNESKYKNRLAKEKSPYLLQYAYNPVDWFPWSDEAFDKAKADDKLIFFILTTYDMLKRA